MSQLGLCQGSEQICAGSPNTPALISLAPALSMGCSGGWLQPWPCPIWVFPGPLAGGPSPLTSQWREVKVGLTLKVPCPA